jgi:hypothetical protein
MFNNYKIGKKSNVILRVLKDDSYPNFGHTVVDKNDPQTMNTMGIEVFGDSYGCNEQLQGGVNNVPTRIMFPNVVDPALDSLGISRDDEAAKLFKLPNDKMPFWFCSRKIGSK